MTGVYEVSATTGPAVSGERARGDRSAVGGRPIVIEPTARDRDPAKAQRRERRLIGALGIAVPVALVALWQLAVRWGWLDVRFFPTPTQILSEWRDMIGTGEYWTHLRASVGRIVFGYLWGGAAGLVLGLIIGRSKFIRASLEPTIVALYTIPKLAILPLLLLLFGIGETPKILLIAIAVFFIVLINTSGALESIAPGHLEAARSFGLGRFDTVRHVILPSALPPIFVGFRLAAGVAVLVVVGAEFVAATSGLGYLIWISWSIGYPTRMYIGIISIAMLGVLVNSLLRLLQRLLVPWER